MSPKTHQIAPPAQLGQSPGPVDTATALAARQQKMDSILEEIGDLYQQINGDDYEKSPDNLIADEVTYEEIIADDSLADETYVIDYGSEDDVPPPTDADYLTFQEPSEVMDAVLKEENPYFSALEAFEWPPESFTETAAGNFDDADAQFATAADDLHIDHDILYEDWYDAEPLPGLDVEESADAPAVAAGNDETPTAAAEQRCRFCNSTLALTDIACHGCGAPLNPKRLFHNLQQNQHHEFNEPNLFLVPCRICGNLIYRRAHVCPNCKNVLLKPVYGVADETGLKFTSPRTAKRKPTRKVPAIAVLVVLAVIAVIVWQTVLTTF